MKNKNIELIVGIFGLFGILAFITLAFKMSDFDIGANDKGYLVKAKFDNIGNLRARAPVTISGVKVGHVASINFNKNEYNAEVILSIKEQYDNIPVDSKAKILTSGLLGSNYISLEPGFENDILANNSEVTETYSAVILENLISKFVMNKDKNA